MSTKIDWEKIRREEFPVLETMTFLDAACVSFAPQRAVRAVKNFADMTARQDEANSSAHHIAMDSLRHKAYQEAAKLFNADPEEIALVESTSHGLNIAAAGIELNDGDSILTTNLEFIQVALPWCKANGIFFVVDAVQQMGVTKIDTKQCHVDVLVAGGHKWANSPYGTGVLYINKESQSKIKQVYGGYLNTTVPEGGWGAYWEKCDAQPVNDWTFPETARKYEIGGTSNYPGAIALGESLGLVNEIGIENIQEHVWELGEYCMDQIEAIGGTLITHRDPGRRAGIIIARLYKDVDIDRKVMRALHARKIFIAQRFTDNVGGFRISCNWFNTKKDIDCMIAGMKDIIDLIGYQPDYRE